MLNRSKTGLALGLFFAVVHAIWAFLIAIVPSQLQAYLDWMFLLHSLEPYWLITNFVFVNAIFLVLMTFIFGYLFGYLFALVWNFAHKARRQKNRRVRRTRRRRRR